MRMKQPVCDDCGSKWIKMYSHNNWGYECMECWICYIYPKNHKKPKIKPYKKRPFAKMVWRLKQLFNNK